MTPEQALRNLLDALDQWIAAHGPATFSPDPDCSCDLCSAGTAVEAALEDAKGTVATPA